MLLAKPIEVPFEVDPNKTDEFLSVSNKEALEKLLAKAKRVEKNMIKK